jgi:isoquinoline 1-oxidoreductase beta subunit
MARLQHPATYEAVSLSRRSFLIAMAGATALFGFPRAAKAAMDPATPTGAPPILVNPLFEPTIWFSIDGDGFVTVNIIRAEMGQHVGTSLARILAEELEADWDKVRIVHVDTDPKWGLMITGGSWSVWQTWPVFSQAGAAGRMALIDEGAKLLRVSPTACTARAGAVVAGEQKIFLWRNCPAREPGPPLYARRTGQAAHKARLRATLDRSPSSRARHTQ